MEFISWPQLTARLSQIPDDAVAPLIMQLVEAVRFLETLGIVHRDIKPDNIHISQDFQRLKVLDLGVAREFELEDGGDAAITDHSNHKPFLATAQYSSPEYLFRLDEPSIKLWKGLNYYQIGAVLHDLIMKRPIFQYEMGLGNRWLVARAVLTKTPSFSDTNPHRLAFLKALASRCLAKDLDTRLQLVGWDDFELETTPDPLSVLKSRLAKSEVNAGENANAAATARIEFDRDDFTRRFTSRIQTELIAICSPKMPLTLSSPTPNTTPVYVYRFSYSSEAVITCELQIKWGDELHNRTATVTLGARLIVSGRVNDTQAYVNKVICTATIGEAEVEALHDTCRGMALAINHGLDVIEGAHSFVDIEEMDLLKSEGSSS